MERVPSRSDSTYQVAARCMTEMSVPPECVVHMRWLSWGVASLPVSKNLEVCV